MRAFRALAVVLVVTSASGCAARLEPDAVAAPPSITPPPLQQTNTPPVPSPTPPPALTATPSLPPPTPSTAPITPAPTAAHTPTPSTLFTNTIGTTACGTVRRFTAPTATAAGSLDIGSHHYALAAGLTTNPAWPVQIGAAQCVYGGLDAPAATPLTAEPLDQWRCGRVRDFLAATSSTPGRISILEYWSWGVATFAIPPGTGLGSPPFDSYRCVAPSVDQATGDAIAVGLDDRLADIDIACGRVKAFVRATATTAGSITIGSRTIAIAAGATYRHDPAGSPTDPTAVGQVICFSGLVDDKGLITRYGPHTTVSVTDASGQPGECGRVAVFHAPTAFADGLIVFSLKSDALRIPAGAPIATVPPCVAIHVDANGDLVVPAGMTPPPVRL